MTELKNLKKGDVVILRAFTGMAIGKKTVTAADAKTVTIETAGGDIKKFSKKTGIQVEPAAKAERFANYITEDDGSYEKELEERKARKATKKAEKPKPEKKPKKQLEELEEKTEELEEEPAPKPEKKPSKKAKKPEPEPEFEEEDDDDDYEEVE